MVPLSEIPFPSFIRTTDGDVPLQTSHFVLRKRKWSYDRKQIVYLRYLYSFKLHHNFLRTDVMNFIADLSAGKFITLFGTGTLPDVMQRRNVARRRQNCSLHKIFYSELEVSLCLMKSMPTALTMITPMIIS